MKYWHMKKWTGCWIISYLRFKKSIHVLSETEYIGSNERNTLIIHTQTHTHIYTYKHAFALRFGWQDAYYKNIVTITINTEAFEGFIGVIKSLSWFNRNSYALLWHVWCFHGALYPRVILIQYSHTTKTSIRYNDVIMSAMASQITGVSIVCSPGCSGADHRKHQSVVPLWGESWGDLSDMKTMG